MKPWYRKKTLWTAVLTGIAAGLGHHTKNPEIANAVMIIGLAVLAKLAVEDHGKGKLEVQANVDSARQQGMIDFVGMLAKHGPGILEAVKSAAQGGQQIDPNADPKIDAEFEEDEPEDKPN